MLCPIMSYHREPIGRINCVEEECVWYNKYKEECCIKTLTNSIEDVAEGQRTIYTKEV